MTESQSNDIWSDIENEILDQYQNDENPRPWIIGFSGGKDSTTLLQVVWKAVLKISPEKRKRDIHVVCNNTLVENPVILSYVKEQLQLIKKAAQDQSMPIIVQHTLPKMNNTFWVNLIGRGYVAPNTLFRWCTERMKINPTSQYIKDQVTAYGGVIILLGIRRSESETRAKSIKRHEVKGKRLSKHNLPGSYVYAPLKEVTTGAIWRYLANTQSPWNSNNNDLIQIYDNASEENDISLALFDNSKASGTSRFGCWVCTVVTNDRSMKNLIDTGESWMRPLLEFRNLLAKTIERDNPDYDPLLYRLPVRRNNQEGLGPYRPRWRYEILKELLKTQQLIQEKNPEIQLITEHELIAIQIVWDRDFIEGFSVNEAYSEVYGRNIRLITTVDEETNNNILAEICKEHPEDLALINSLTKAQKNKILLVKKVGLQNQIEKILEEHIEPTITNAYTENSN